MPTGSIILLAVVSAGKRDNAPCAKVCACAGNAGGVNEEIDGRFVRGADFKTSVTFNEFEVATIVSFICGEALGWFGLCAGYLQAGSHDD